MSAAANIVALDRATRTAPFGVRFWDPVRGRAVIEGLELTELRSGRAAQASASGALVFTDLPGLSASSFGTGDARFWSSPPEQAAFAFELRDRTASFMPFTFNAQVPFRGLFSEDLGLGSSPPEGGLAGLPLYSSPTRLVPAGTAVVRAQLNDGITGTPASAAVLEVSAAAGPTYRGFADDLGRVAVLFPYPESLPLGGLPHRPAASPGGQALAAQTWTLSIGVRYAPMGSSPDSAPPDLRAVLSQPFARLSPGGPVPSARVSARLVFGVDLVLRTAGQSELLVLPT